MVLKKAEPAGRGGKGVHPPRRDFWGLFPCRLAAGDGWYSSIMHCRTIAEGEDKSLTGSSGTYRPHRDDMAVRTSEFTEPNAVVSSWKSSANVVTVGPGFATGKAGVAISWHCGREGRSCDGLGLECEDWALSVANHLSTAGFGFVSNGLCLTSASRVGVMGGHRGVACLFFSEQKASKLRRMALGNLGLDFNLFPGSGLVGPTIRGR